MNAFARRRMLAVLFGASLPVLLSAQDAPLQTALADGNVQRAIADVDGATAWTSALLVKLGSIVSPSGHERLSP